VVSNLGQAISLFSNSKKNVRGHWTGGALYVSKLTTNNNKLAWIAIWLSYGSWNDSWLGGIDFPHLWPKKATLEV
jgi:hypothetical protein